MVSSPHNPAPPRQGHSRLLGWLLPAFLIGYFLNAYHLVAFDHVVCPLDGHLAHANPGDDSADEGDVLQHAHGEHRHDHAAAGHDSHAGASEESGQEEHEHRHCEVPTLGLEGDSPPAQFALAASTEGPSAQVLQSGAAQAFESIERLLLAPKNSPPV